MSGSFGRARVTAADRQLVKALNHPIRAEALTTLNARTASPNEIANELNLHVGTVSYHVNVLHKLGCVELVDTAQRRGATEHYFRGTAERYLSDGFWAKLSPAVRNGISVTGIRVLIKAVRDSLKAGILDRRPNRHVSVVSYNLHEEDWDEANELLDGTLKRLMEIGARSESNKNGAGPIRATFGLLGFESPSE